MKLRKALDRAVKERGRTTQPPAAPAPPVASPKAAPSDKKEDPWTAPAYTDSREMRIDPDRVAANRGVCIRGDAPEIEYYKILRTRIRQMAGKRKMNTLMVTSANSNEGKTVTCLNMGLVFAKEFHQTVLLVDCDFKGQDLHKYLGVENDISLIDYFINDTPLNRLITWPGIDKLTMISGSNTVVNATELLASDMMKELIHEMGSRYEDRYVFFDAPPVLERSEAIALAPMMDGILMVVEAGTTPKKDIEKAVGLLPRDKFLGFVLNKKE